ncbi:MAG TPA: hypothetical protein VFZ00_07060, partial [Solirubrobacter sp.]|nr:hypothetical protein [Solirubrobacter sp.]
AEPPAAPDWTAAVTPASPAAAAAPTVADVSPDAAVPPTAATAASPAAVAPTSAAAAPAPAGAEPRVVAASVARTSRISSSPTMYRARPALAAPDRERGLRRALAALAAEDSVAAGTLIAGLLPAQGAVIEDTLTYDLTIRGIGTFAVFVAGGDVRVQRTHRARGRGESAFHLNAEPLALAELLAGERRKVRRFGRAARYSGRRKNLRALAALPAARLSLAEAVRAGATLEPSLLYRALPYAVPAEWTRGHVFTVEQVITELAPRAWYITARDGVPLQVIEYAAGAAADATVTMSRAAFDRLLRGEAPSDGDRPTIHGDHNAVATLKRWTDLIV